MTIFKTGDYIYFRNRDGDSVPGIVINPSGYHRINRHKMLIEGDWPKGIFRRWVKKSECSLQSDEYLGVPDEPR